MRPQNIIVSRDVLTEYNKNGVKKQVRAEVCLITKVSVTMANYKGFRHSKNPKTTVTFCYFYIAPIKALIAATFTISSTLQPRERSNAGFFNP